MSYYTSVIIFALMALAVLSVLIYENSRIPKDKKRLFILTNLVIASAAIAECGGVHIAGNPSVPSGVLAAVKAADYTLTPLTGGILIILMRESSAKKFHVGAFFIGNTVFQIVSAFTGWMVVIDSGNRYVHGPLYPVYMVFCFAVLLLLAVSLVSYGKSFRRQNRISLYATVFLVSAGNIMQEVLGSDCRLTYLALTFGSAYLFIHYSEFAQLRMDDTISEQQVRISIDPLTGVFSRFAYVDAINACAGGLSDNFCVFMADINGLKAANDSLGHEAGDELIRGAAQCIAGTLGKNGRTFRIGGDEFVVLADMTRGQADSALLELERAAAAWSGERVKKLSVSAGCALACEHEGFSAEELAKAADGAMYEQKKQYYSRSSTDRRRRPS